MTDKNRLRCPICSGEEFTELFPALEGVLAAVKCDGCALGVERTLTPHPAVAYRTHYDGARDHSAGSNRWRRFHHDRTVAEDRFNQIAPHTKDIDTRTWTDVGCNNGAVLVAATVNGWRALGVEQNKETAEETEQTLGACTIPYWLWVQDAHRDRGIRPVRRSGVVSFFDALEHLFDPAGALLAAARYAVPGGLIVVEVPDLSSAEPGPGGAAWRHRRVTPEFTEHIWHFSAPSLRRAAQRFLPEFDEVSCASPVPTKLQMIWRKRVDGPSREDHRTRAVSRTNEAPDSTVITPFSVAPAAIPVVVTWSTEPTVTDKNCPVMDQVGAVAQHLSALPAEEYEAARAAVRESNAAFARAVQDRIDRIRKTSGGG